MSPFHHLVRFESEEDGNPYFADLGPEADGPPLPGARLSGTKTIEGLAHQSDLLPLTLRHVSLQTMQPAVA
jgi:hypothetical protein